MTADYDVIIIGAGIQGAGVAQAAAASGYKTLVIEKNQHAGLATSSKSSKLIHGGLRYLESGQFSLVKECLSERATLLKIAPQLVKLTPFYIPVIQTGSRPGWKIWIGLTIYSLLSMKPFRILSRQHWKQLGDLKTKDIKYIFKYYDAQTNDTKLTQAVAASAEKLGAQFLYNTEFIKSEAQNKIHTLSYRKNSNITNTTSYSIVNCAGPWVSSVQEKIKPQLTLPHIDLVAGTHIIIDKKTQAGAFYLEAVDNRVIFILPWNEKSTLIGTTEKTFLGNPDKIQPTTEEISYLINTYNEYFENTISMNNVIDSFAGLRVLPGSEISSFERPRESIIFQDAQHPEIISLIGGKLTAYRASSEQIMKKLIDVLPVRKKLIDTSKISLQPDS